MTDTAFESKVTGIFSRMEQRLSGRLAVEKAKTENLQSQDTRRMAFILTEAIEGELEPAVKQALASYDEAINRPMLPNERWEQQLLQKIGQAVDASIKLALALDKESHPWKPLLSAEGPKIRTRLTGEAEQHFAALGKKRGRRGGSADGVPDWAVWVALFAAGLVAGFILAHLTRA
jgi:predicted DNA-binding protein